MAKKQCNGNVDECFKCGNYYCSHSPHYERINGKLREVINITCCYGTAGIFDANTRERIQTI